MKIYFAGNGAMAAEERDYINSLIGGCLLIMKWYQVAFNTINGPG